MPFKQGRRPCLVLNASERRRFRGALFASGYKLHRGPRVTRRGEEQAWVAQISRGRQVHVQEVRRSDGLISVFAHTEPEGYGPKHLFAALLDQVSFSGGARALLADLRSCDWDV